jgi:hypothetical protein
MMPAATFALLAIIAVGIWRVAGFLERLLAGLDGIAETLRQLTRSVQSHERR